VPAASMNPAGTKARERGVRPSSRRRPRSACGTGHFLYLISSVTSRAHRRAQALLPTERNRYFRENCSARHQSADGSQSSPIKGHISKSLTKTTLPPAQPHPAAGLRATRRSARWPDRSGWHRNSRRPGPPSRRRWPRASPRRGGTRRAGTQRSDESTHRADPAGWERERASPRPAD